MSIPRVPPALTKLGALVLAGISVIACARTSAAPTLASLRGRIHHDSELLLLPTVGWRADARRLLVDPGSAARLLIDVRATSDLPLLLRFEPTRPSKTAPLAAALDGGALAELVIAGDGAAELAIPAARLTAGAHELTVAARSDSTAPVALRRVGWSRGRIQGAFGRAAVEAGRWAHELASVEVGGGADEKLGGVLAFGTHRMRAAVAAERGAVLRLTLHALVGRDAAVAVGARVGGRERELWSGTIGAGERRPLRIVLPPGTTEIELSGRTSREDEAIAWGELTLLSERARAPLVVLMTLDTTRRDALGAYGRRPSPTPNLDRFAAGATLYVRASSTTSWTLPAHASIFTGLAPSEHTAGVSRGELPAGSPTLARLVSDRYRTIGVVGGPLVRPVFGVARGFGIYRPAQGIEGPARRLTRTAIELLEESSPDPVFLFLNYFDAHWPYLPPEDLPASRAVAEKIAALPPGSLWRHILAGENGPWLRVLKGEVPIDPQGLEAVTAAYFAEVEEMDRQIGVLLDFLRATGRFNSALIVAAGDHGELLGEGGLLTHAYRLDPELTDIPLIVKYPSQVEARRVEAQASLSDLFPTILEAAGVEPPPTGAIALTDLARLARRRQVLFEEHRSQVHGLPPRLMSLGPHVEGLETSRTRIVRWESGEECRELAGGRWTKRPCNEPLRTALGRAFAALRALAKRPTAGAEALDPEEEERLRSLGYL
jgi:hypothetical protein